MADEDTQLALHLCYGLFYDGFIGVDDIWEWDPSLLGLRATLEDGFLCRLEDRCRGLTGSGTQLDGQGLVASIRTLIDTTDGPSLSSHMLDQNEPEQLREFLIHRSIYQRKEADPHTWAIPRLRGRAKSACVLLQFDEYGSGVPGRSHAELFADVMVAFDLDPTPGAYIDVIPAVTLATDNLVSCFGLHRRWRGALVGHLAAFEMTSVTPMSRYAAVVRRHLSDTAAEFYDVHVVADALHEKIAADELLTGLAETDIEAAQDAPFGAAALFAVEEDFSRHLLSAWQEGRSSLRDAPPSPTVGPFESFRAGYNGEVQAVTKPFRLQSPAVTGS